MLAAATDPKVLQVVRCSGTRQLNSALPCRHLLGRSLPRTSAPDLAPRSGHEQRSRTRLTVSAAKAAAAAKSVSSAATGTALWSAVQQAITPLAPYLLAVAACLCTCNILLMAVLPNWGLTQRLSSSNLPYLLLGGAYLALLAASWQTDTLSLMMPGSLAEGMSGFKPQFFPALSDIQALFNRTGLTAASFLAHVLAINLFAARSLWVDGSRTRVPTAHSVLLCALLGPLGLLCHWLTKGFYSVVSQVTGRDLRPSSPAVVERSGDGTITMLPYE